jgi:succinate dehydrogenase / fumarate reductase, iron-sulfur subunit
MQINLKVFRFNPEKDQKPHFDAFSLEVDPKDRILDVLEQVRGYHDGSLGYRRSCAHGVCGSDAMRVNGRNYLACKILVQDLKSNEITVEPILGLKVIKDLIVDMEPFFRHFESVKPYFVNEDPLPADGKERLQSPEDRERFDDTTKCILCAACTTSCPSFWADGSYVGPAAIVNAHRFIFDTRDKAAAERLKTLNEQFGVWRCRTVFNCTEACPRDIHITQAIAEIKQALLSGKLK